jgi:hypothetical protein
VQPHELWHAGELDALRRQVKSDAIEAGARDAVERLVEVARQQLAAGMLPAQVMGDLLASVTTAQREDDADAQYVEAGRRWVTQCGSCDGGLPMSCTCQGGDPRPVIAALLRIIERPRPDAAGGVEVIAAGAVVMIAQDRIERGR